MKQFPFGKAIFLRAMVSSSQRNSRALRILKLCSGSSSSPGRTGPERNRSGPFSWLRRKIVLAVEHQHAPTASCLMKLCHIDVKKVFG